MMSDFISAVRRQTGEFFKKRSKTQKALMAIGAAVLVTAIILAAVLGGKVEYEVLYTGLDESEAGDIMVRLDDMGVAAKAQGSSTILVPSDSADETRMTLASEGYPQSGLNYDLFGSSATLGATDLQMQTYLQYQLQDNLRSTILKLDRIADCIVIINMPSESLFVLSSDESEASASVTVEVKNGEQLTHEEVQAIANLVLKSVSGLELENISIVDNRDESVRRHGSDRRRVYDDPVRADAADAGYVQAAGHVRADPCFRGRQCFGGRQRCLELR